MQTQAQRDAVAKEEPKAFQSIEANIEIEQLKLDVAELQRDVKELEDARQVQIRLNREFREAIGKNVKLTTPEKKSIWDYFLKGFQRK